jgi:hypothetical protein
MTTGSTWIGDRIRRQAEPIVGLRRLYTYTPGRRGVISHRPKQHVCPHTMISELSSSWTARTSQEWAFQNEVARSDLVGTRRKMWDPPWKHLGKGWEAAGIANEGTNGPLLPTKDNRSS